MLAFQFYYVNTQWTISLSAGNVEIKDGIWNWKDWIKIKS